VPAPFPRVWYVNQRVDNSLVIAIIASVTTASSTAGVAITALVISNKRIDRVEAALDRFGAKLESIDTHLEMLTGSIHDLDKRLSLLEDRILNRPQ